jgi:hypothetical protein
MCEMHTRSTASLKRLNQQGPYITSRFERLARNCGTAGLFEATNFAYECTRTGTNVRIRTGPSDFTETSSCKSFCAGAVEWYTVKESCIYGYALQARIALAFAQALSLVLSAFAHP